MVRNNVSLTEKAAIVGGGCLVLLVTFVIWIIAVAIQLCVYGGIIACLVAGAYWLCTGEFIFSGAEVDPSVVVDQANGPSNH